AAMAFVVDNDELAAEPRLVQSPRRVEGATEVKTPVDDSSRYAGQAIGVPHDLVILQPRVVAPAVRDLASECETEPGVVVARVRSRIRRRRHLRILQTTPLDRRGLLDCRVRVHQQDVVGIDQPQITQLGRYVIAEASPLGGEDPSSVHRERVDVSRSSRVERTEHERTHAIRVTFGVGGTEHRSPRQTEHDPSIDAEVLAQLLDVGDVMVHVDRRPVDVRLGRVWRTAAGGSLIEQHGAMSLRIEVGACTGREARTRPTVQVDDRSAVFVADLLVVQGVAITDVELAHGSQVLVSMTQKRLPSVSAITTKSGSGGYRSQSTTDPPRSTRSCPSPACSAASTA